jgi:predicted ATPase/class 3 adenylate cyclase
MPGRLEDWLTGIGLVRYAELFAAHAIDLDVLADLNDSDLEHLGIPLGDRKRLLKAIAARTPAVPEQRASAPSAAREEAERRQVTIMFCDLVGWTQLSTRLDPEDLREVLAAYHDACNRTIARYAGFVAKLLGDGVLVYFGFPQAHEDDPERAVRAALELAGLVPGLRLELGLAVRIGVATGLVVVGDIIGEGASEQRAAIGETPNLAARLQALAGPGEVVISPATRRLAGGVFDYEDLGAQALKGIAQPVRPWRVLAERRTESRFEAQHAERLTSFVGRDQEVALLLERWARAMDGDGQVVLLTGEAGIGKSRVTEALRERIGDEPHTRVRYQCSPHRTHSALHPMIAQLEFAAGLAVEDSPGAKLDKLEALLGAGTAQPASVAPLFAELLAIPAAGRYPALELTPAARKQKILDALVDQLAGLARRAPVLVILEDAHWIDPTTDELFGLTVERLRDWRALLIVTCRPEYVAPWKGRDHVTALSLNRLGRRHGAAIVAELVGRAALPANVVEQIVARADGVPLFLEELTKAIIEAGEGRVDAETLARAATSESIPSTLRDSLLARLDRLGPAKEVAQIGAVIGREFPFVLLSGAYGSRTAELVAALDQLEAAGLVFSSGRPPEATYTFKHALVQDAAYSTLLRSRRQQLHTAIAQAIERDFPQHAEAEPELLAHHYDEAGLPEPALRYWLRAGERSIERSANHEATAQLGRGLELIRSLEASPERDRLEFALRMPLGIAQMGVFGHGGMQVADTFRRARELGEALGDVPRTFAASWNLWINRQTRHDLTAARLQSEELLRIARSTGEEDHLLQANHAAWSTQTFLGAFETAKGHVDEGLRLYDIERHRSHALRFGGHDRGVCGHSLGAIAYWSLGLPDEAAARATRGIEIAGRRAHPNSSALGLAYSALVHAVRHEIPQAHELAAQSVAPIAEYQLSRLTGWASAAVFLDWWARARLGEREGGHEQMKEELARYRANRVLLFRTFLLGLYAEDCGASGRVADGLAAVGEALELARTSGEKFWLAELHRVRSDLLLRQSAANLDEAERELRAALEVARGQRARMLELRAGTSLATLLSGARRRAEALEVLRPAYASITEGHDTADLVAARTLLESLS